MAALLFVDMLGVKATWQRKGRPGAEDAFARLKSVLEEVSAIARPLVLSGSLESDSIALVCHDLHGAVRVGCALFKTAFRAGRTGGQPRMWLRGVIVPCPDDTPLRVRAASAALPMVEYSTLAPALLEGIATEKAGFRGMRLLVGGGFSRNELRSARKIRLAQNVVADVLKRVAQGAYPLRLYEARFYDVYWMATEDEDEWVDLRAIMAGYVRDALGDPEELLHAGTTSAIFVACGTYVGAVCRQHDIPRRGAYQGAG